MGKQILWACVQTEVDCNVRFEALCENMQAEMQLSASGHTNKLIMLFWDDV